MDSPILPKQPPVFISYLRVGKLLYISLGLFAAESYFFWRLFKSSRFQEQELMQAFWLICFLFSFVHIFLVLMDGWSRFQNYKKIKDLFYQHGFKVRIAMNYKGSKCQRNAAIVAAEELGFGNDVRRLYKKLGIKEYHLLPDFFVQDPFFLFKNSFWSRTFLEKYYSPKFDFRSISKMQIPVN